MALGNKHILKPDAKFSLVLRTHRERNKLKNARCNAPFLFPKDRQICNNKIDRGPTQGRSFAVMRLSVNLKCYIYVIAVIKYRVRGAKVIEPKSEDNNKTCKRWTYVQVKLLHSECRGEM